MFTRKGPKRLRRTRRELPHGQVRCWPKGPGYYQPNRERATRMADTRFPVTMED